MRAIRCNGPDGVAGLRLEEVPSPTAGDGEVLVQVVACGLNFPDLLISKGKYQIKPAPPFTLGGEFAGIVMGIGPNVEGFTLGDRVAGFTTIGAFADRMIVDASRAYRIPEGISFEVAAGFALNYATALAGLKSFAKLQRGETALVLGAAGGIGLAAIELGKVLGARIIACASSEEKLEICRAHGADATIHYNKQGLREAVRELTQDRGVDVIVDPVGGAYSEAAFRTLAWRGRHLILGFAAGDIAKLPLNLPLLKGGCVLGLSIGQFAKQEPVTYAENLSDLWQLLQSGALRPHIGSVYPLEEVADALSCLESRQAIGKIIVSVRPREVAN